MLPFLKKGQFSAMIISHKQKPDGSIQPDGPADDGLKEALFDMFKAAQAQEWDLAAKAFESAFDILESLPHEEAEHEEEEEEK